MLYMAERGEYSPARWWRLKLYTMKPHWSAESGSVCFYPTNAIREIKRSENNCEEAVKNVGETVLFESNPNKTNSSS